MKAYNWFGKLVWESKETVCAECENHLVADYWYCKAYPNLPFKDLVTGSVQEPNNPYMFCSQVNSGYCRYFKDLKCKE